GDQGRYRGLVGGRVAELLPVHELARRAVDDREDGRTNPGENPAPHRPVRTEPARSAVTTTPSGRSRTEGDRSQRAPPALGDHDESPPCEKAQQASQACGAEASVPALIVLRGTRTSGDRKKIRVRDQGDPPMSARPGGDKLALTSTEKG